MFSRRSRKNKKRIIEGCVFSWRDMLLIEVKKEKKVPDPFRVFLCDSDFQCSIWKGSKEGFLEKRVKRSGV